MVARVQQQIERQRRPDADDDSIEGLSSGLGLSWRLLEAVQHIGLGLPKTCLQCTEPWVGNLASDPKCL